MTTPLTIADLSILGAVFAYLAPAGISKFSGRKDYDNARPRDPAFFADPLRARALWAHQNGIEGFALFAVAVVLAELHGAAQPVVDGLALAYLVLRAAYVAAYVADKPTLRSLVWGLAMAANVAILLSPAFAKV